MIFLRPWILLLLLVPLFLFWRRRRQQNGGAWRTVCDPHLLPYLIIRFKNKEWHVYAGLMAFLWCFAVFCAAGPAFERKPMETGITRKGIAVVVDMSPAMTPEKLFQARLKLYDLLQTQSDADLALVLTDAKAYTALPMTSDKKIFENILPSLTERVMPVRGENPAAGIERAATLLRQAGFKQGRILLLTGGLSEPEKLMTAVQSSAYPVSILGIGAQTDPRPVQLPSGQFWEKTPGTPVLAGLNARLLSQGALFETASLDEEDLKRLLADVRLEKQEGTTAPLILHQDIGVFGLLLLLPLTALLFRRGILFMLLFGLMLPMGAEAGPWRRTEQAMYDRHQTAVAAYRKGDYENAADLFARTEGTEALYNLGNALAFQGKIEKAIQTYEAVLKQNPQHEDAAFNLDYLKKQQTANQQNQAQNGQGGGQIDNQNDKTDSPSASAGDTSENDEQSASENTSSNTESPQQTSAEDSVSDNLSETRDNSEDKDDPASRQTRKDTSSDEENGQAAAQADASETPAGDEKGPVISAAAQQQEEWLERIDSDPGRLLRIRLLRQYEAQK